jgi:hypothetical protein
MRPSLPSRRGVTYAFSDATHGTITATAASEPAISGAAVIL